MLVLDSDLLSILLRGPEAERGRVMERLNRADDEPVSVTIITFEEQMRGWMAVLARSKMPRQLVPAYQRLHAVLRDFQAFPIFDSDESAADLFLEPRRRHRLGPARPI